MSNTETLQYVCRWLNHSALPTGETLNAQWDSTVISRDGRKRWEFRPGEMAPGGRMGVYGCIDGVGRILPAALHPSRAITVRRVSADSAAIDWRVPIGGSIRRVTLYERLPAPTGDKQPSLKRIGTFDQDREHHNECASVTGLKSAHRYCVVVEACIDNRPDPSIVSTSDPIPVPEKP